MTPRFRFAGIFLLLLACPLVLLSQLPPNQPEQDCINAIPVCQDVYVQNNAYTGAGNNPDEIDPANSSCRLLGEINSVWYVFRIETPGDLCFTITPNDSTEDYDWTVYNITNASCADIATNPSLEVSCSWVAPDLLSGCSGRTGPNGDTAGPCGAQNQSCIAVSTGETYVVNVSNFTGLDNGYVLDFSASTATLFDDTPPDMVGAEPTCTGVEIEFSENVLCSTVDPSDFTVTGPGGPYTIAAVNSVNCDAGGDFDTRYSLTLSPLPSSPATYTVNIVGNVSDFCGNPANLTSQDVYLIPPPTSSINPQLDQCLESNVFNFEYDGPFGVTAFFWDFGDGSTSNTRLATHQYSTSGAKTVSLEVRDTNGCRDTATSTVIVHPTPQPNFAPSGNTCEDDIVNFSNTSVIDSGGVISNYIWNLGDGSTTSDTMPSHIYNNPGNYNINLIAISDNNCQDSYTETLSIYPKPEVAFTLEEVVCVNDDAEFENKSTIDNVANDVIQSWFWSFGDGSSTSNGNIVTHAYSNPGIFPVSLSVTSDKGCTDSAFQSIEIYQTPAPQVISDTACFSNRAILEVVPDSGGINMWYSDMTGADLVFTGDRFQTDPLDQDLIFYVETVSPEKCISDRVPISANVFMPDDIEILPSDSIAFLPGAFISFNIQGNLTGLDFNWTFGDGSTSGADFPAHEYQYPGIYPVRANIVDVYGCQYFLETFVEVINESILHIPNSFTPNGDGINDEFYVGTRQLRKFRIFIFDRFGRTIFESDNTDFRWNGENNKSRSLPSGVYSYKVDAIDISGNKVTKVGTITLLR